MNKKEYLTRVFQGQVNSLSRDIIFKESEVHDLETALAQAKLDLEGSKEVLKIAQEELENASKD